MFGKVILFGSFLATGAAGLRVNVNTNSNGKDLKGTKGVKDNGDGTFSVKCNTDTVLFERVAVKEPCMEVCADAGKDFDPTASITGSFGSLMKVFELKAGEKLVDKCHLCCQEKKQKKKEDEKSSC